MFSCSIFDPSDRGQCYFNGQYSSSASMWQIIDLITLFNLTIIDRSIMNYNFSAWIGGWDSNDDHAQVLLTFYDQNNTLIGSQVMLGPVLASDRNARASLLYREAIGLVPASTRSVRVLVLFTRIEGQWNDGAIDNIAFIPYL